MISLSMKKYFKVVFLLTLSISIFARDIKPTFVLKSKGLVNDFVIDGVKLYVANDIGSVEVFDLTTRKVIDEIFIKSNLSGLGDMVAPKILSVDRRNGKTLILSTTTSGYRNLWIKQDNKKLKHIINTENKIVMKKALFLDDNNLMLGTLGYDVIKYTLKDNFSTYKNQIEQSSFSDMVISQDKKTLASVSETGIVTISDTKSGKIIKRHKGINLDNVYKLAFRDGNVIAAGKDRRVGVYPKDAKPYYIKSDFLVYCVGISFDGKTGIYSSGEDNNLQLFDIKTGNKTHRLIGHYAIPSTIKFFDEKGLFSAGYENSIFYWHIE